MQRIQLDSKDGLADGWIGVGDARNVPERVRTSIPNAPELERDLSASDDAPRNGGWVRAGLRFVRNAVIGLALLMTVPFGVIELVGGRFQSWESAGARARLQSAERLRGFKAPTDASITPMQAGVAFRALQSGKSTSEFPMRGGGEAYARPWRTLPLKGKMFIAVPKGATPAFLAPSQTLYAAQSELSPEELEYLRGVAEAPIWQDFDRVAAAGAVDIIGGQFVLPFSDKALAPQLPVLRYAETKELAHAAVTRAGYYVATHEFDRAEAILRKIVSFGFVLIDNATSGLDAAIGRTITETGRDGLLQLYSMQSNEELLKSVRPAKEFAMREAAAGRKGMDSDALRAALLADVNNPDVPRGLRFEGLRGLSFAACGNAREVLLGPNKDIRDAFASAKQSLARFPSEQAYVDLLYHFTDRIPEDAGVKLGPERFIVGAATIAGMVLNNPRVAACTRMAMLSF